MESMEKPKAYFEHPGRVVAIDDRFKHAMAITLDPGHRKNGSWYVPTNITGVEGSVMLNQARILDKARLSNKIATLNPDAFEDIKTRFRRLYCP